MKPVFISIGLFVLSLTQPCYCTASNCADSVMVLLIGWLGAFSGGAALTWLANPVLLLSWLTAKRNVKTALLASLFATLIALSFLLFGEVTANESGQSQQIISYKAGYWLWLASSVIMFLGNAYVHLSTIRQLNTAP